MGMSASQARLIALTARMSDVEYEGQQINQARLTLASNIAECTNKLYAMTPPTAPNQLDFTTLKYVGKSADGTVNYQVSKGKLQVEKTGQLIVPEDSGGTQLPVSQATIRGSRITDFSNIMPDKTDTFYEEVEDDKADYFISSAQKMVRDANNLYVEKAEKKTITDEDLATAWGSQAEPTKFMKTESQLIDGVETEVEVETNAGDTAGYPVEWKIPDFEKASSPIADGTACFVPADNGIYSPVGTAGTTFVDMSTVQGFEKSAKGFQKCSLEDGKEAYVGFASKPSVIATVAMADAKPVLDPSKLSGVYIVEGGYAKKATAENLLDSDGNIRGDIDYVLQQNNNGEMEPKDYEKKDKKVVGGSETATISEMTSKLKGATNDKSASKWFDALQGLRNSNPDLTDAELENEYTVIIQDNEFKFCHTRDLEGDSVVAFGVSTGSVFVDSDEGVSPICDGEGNITGYKLSNGTSIKMEAVRDVDQNAYKAAELKYQQEKFDYDKECAAINKQTSLYQLEDKKLDMKLKRLDTERNALNTEIDAVKKVIQDATDKGFKTFSG